MSLVQGSLGTAIAVRGVTLLFRAQGTEPASTGERGEREVGREAQLVLWRCDPRVHQSPWSEEFDLQARFTDLSEEFSDFGFGDVGADNDLMLRCCAAILKGDPAPASMIDINGTEVRQQFDVVEKSLRLAIDFLRSNLQVRHVKFLPYSAQLIPLAAYFSINQSSSVAASDVQTLLRWFWRGSFVHRYSGNPARNIKVDVQEAVKLRKGDNSTLDRITGGVDATFFSGNLFSARTVATKAFILLLASRSPLTFLSGQAVNLDDVLSEPDRKEYHHCMPRAWMRDNRQQVSDSATNSLANFAENRTIKDHAPSVYRTEMPTDISAIAESALLPESLWNDDETFLSERAEALAAYAQQLAGWS